MRSIRVISFLLGACSPAPTKAPASSAPLPHDSALPTAHPDADTAADTADEPPVALPSCIDAFAPQPAPDPLDCDADGTPDADALAFGLELDCDADGLPDRCDALVDPCTVGHAEGWMEYQVGTLPIILSAPHGGTDRTDAITDRAESSFGDTNTQELTLAVADALEARTGARPHVVLFHLHRREVEVNAWTEADATAGEPDAIAAYHAYHALIDHAAAAVQWRYGRGLYVDLHGLAASRTTNELGYLLSGTSYAADADRLAHPGYAAHSSLRAAETRQRVLSTGFTFDDMVRGPQSIGGLLEARGYTMVPSPTHPYPTDEDGEPRGYFDGGYSTGAHGSRLGGTIDGVQIEHLWDEVRADATTRQAYAEALAQSLEIWLATFHQLPLTTSATVGFVAESEMVWNKGAPRTLWLERRGDTSTALTVALEADGAEDLLTVPPSLTFNEGERLGSVEVAAVDDAREEGPHRVTVRVSASAEVLQSERAEVTVWVADDTAPTAWLRSDTSTVWGDAPTTVALRRDDCPTDAAPPLAATGLEGLTLRHPHAGIVQDGDPLTIPAGTAEIPLSLETPTDGRAGPRRPLVLGLSADTSRPDLTLDLFDPDLDPTLVSWLAPLSVEPDAAEFWDHAQPSSVQRLPSPTDGPLPGRVGWHFDGVEDAVLLDAVPLSAEARPLTVAWWFRASSAKSGSYGYMLSHGRYSASGALNVYLTSAGTLRTVPTGRDETYDYDLLDVPDALWDDTWHHVALTIEDLDGMWTARVYLDGVLRSEGARGAGGLATAGLGLFWGSRHDTWPTTHFAGDLADLRILQRALAPDEVADIAAAAP